MRMLLVILLFLPAVRAAFGNREALFQPYDPSVPSIAAILRSHTTTTMYAPKYVPYSQNFEAGPVEGAFSGRNGGTGGSSRVSEAGEGAGVGQRLPKPGENLLGGVGPDLSGLVLSLDPPRYCGAFLAPAAADTVRGGAAEGASGEPWQGTAPPAGDASLWAAGDSGDCGEGPATSGSSGHFGSAPSRLFRLVQGVQAWALPWRSSRAAPGPEDVYMQRLYVDALDSAGNTVYSSLLTKDSLSLCALAESGFDPELRQAGAANGELNRDRRDALGFWRRQEYGRKSLLREKQGFPRQATFFDSSEILRAGTSYTERCMIPFVALKNLLATGERGQLVFRLRALALNANQQWEEMVVPVIASEAPVTVKDIPSFGRRDYLDMRSDESINGGTYYSTFPLLVRTADDACWVAHQVVLEINLFPGTLLNSSAKSYRAGVPVARVLYANIRDNVAETAPVSALRYPMPLTQVTLNAYTLNGRRPYRISDTMESAFAIVSHASSYLNYDFPTFEVIILAVCLITALLLSLFKSMKTSSGAVFSTFQGFLMAFSGLLGGATGAFCLTMLVFSVAYLFARPWFVGSGILTEKPIFFTLASGAGLSAFHYLFSRILQLYPIFSIVDWEGGRSASSILDTVNDERGMGGSSLWRREQLILMLRDLYRHREVTFPKVLLSSMFILVGFDMVYQAVPTMQFSMTIGELDRWYIYLVFFLSCMFSFFCLKLMYFVRNFFRKNPVERAGDYLSLLNCSLFVFEGTSSGFYIHGRAPCGTVEVPLETITDGLQREARGLLPRRGLKQGTSLQYFRFYFRPNTTPTTTLLARIVARLAEIASPDPHVTQQMSDEDFNGTMSGELSVVNSRPKFTVSTFSRARLLKLNDVERGLENLASNVLAALPVTYTPLYHSLFNIPAFAKTRSAGSGKDILLVADPVETRRKRDDGAKPPGGLGLTPWLGWIFPFGIEIKETLMGTFVACGLAWELRSPILGAGVSCLMIFLIDFFVTFFWERKLCESTMTRKSSLL